MLHKYRKWLIVKDCYDEDDVQYDGDQNPRGSNALDSSEESTDSSDASVVSDVDSE